MNIKVVMEKSEDGKFFIYVPSLPGVIAEGRNQDEALKEIREAISSSLEPYEEDMPQNKENLQVIEI
ncbi:MAG: HicB family protein [Candidatus Hydrogenedentes bacterium CG07_land_8_20_14_0_80_42_17]|nr:MAG: HicB family protein [Candidatus Hydrogenedentes bacterium CG1_02_42_14]PIU47575.1 MAG: HicB family protein [Candidatus Hydrogenedentes bacterium CG07_land_8_20_14_0_80_42_17]